MADDICSLLVELDEEETLRAVTEALEQGVDPVSLVEELRDGMAVVGSRFESKEYYLSELIMSAEIFKEAIALIEPRLPGGTGGARGLIIIGTVKGDIHDIGKNIVVTLLRCEGYEVRDLGVDVPPEMFAASVAESGSRLLALSGLLTPAFDEMKLTVEALAARNLRDSTRVIIGGGPVNEQVVAFTGADAWGKDAAEAVRLAAAYIA